MKLHNPLNISAPGALLLMIAFSSVILLAGCSMSHSAMSHPQITSEEVFIQEMIPHHQEAIDSSTLMLDSENPEIRALAQQIISAQEQEVVLMNTWLDAWYPSSTYAPTYTAMMPDLSKFSGSERDAAYLKGMIGHHDGAIQMAKQAQTVALRTEVRSLTENIINTQEKEIQDMRLYLKKT